MIKSLCRTAYRSSICCCKRRLHPTPHNTTHIFNSYCQCRLNSCLWFKTQPCKVIRHWSIDVLMGAMVPSLLQFGCGDEFFSQAIWFIFHPYWWSLWIWSLLVDVVFSRALESLNQKSICMCCNDSISLRVAPIEASFDISLDRYFWLLPKETRTIKLH